MASSKQYLAFILDQFSGLEGITCRPMMGEYLLYYQGKLFGGIYDDRLLVKNIQSARKVMPAAELELPYEGAKEMLSVTDVDDRELLSRLVKEMWDELPAPKKGRR
ncbi:MAG: TfoX/Sxy family protein [Clostridia bacterium]|nr:TfoX/Sxy family protein [Clostridia bacterium]